MFDPLGSDDVVAIHRGPAGRGGSAEQLDEVVLPAPLGPRRPKISGSHLQADAVTATTSWRDRAEKNSRSPTGAWNRLVRLFVG
jgi:hypothetical protein